jgi:PAS domain S-box-containing protein
MNVLCIGAGADSPARILARRGLAVTSVMDVATALPELERKTYPLIVLCVQDGPQGVEACQTLRADAHASNAMVLVVAARDLEDPVMLELRLSLAERHAAERANQHYMEQALRESEERFRRLSEVSMDGVLLHENGVVIDVNEALTQLQGYDRGEMIGQNIRRFVTPESMEGILAHVRSDSDEPYEAVGVRKDGSTFPAEIRGQVVRYQGRNVRVASVRDLTERRRAEAANAERMEKERFRQLSEAGFEALLVHDHGAVVDVNDAFIKIVGYSRSELIGMSGLETVSPESRDIVRRNIESGSEIPYEIIGLRKDGSKFPAELRGKNVVYGGKSLRVVAVRDLTERERLQQTLRVTERLVSMGALAAGMGHEINNPLAYAMANLRLLSTRLAAMATVVPPEERAVLAEAVNQAHEGCERIRVIVRDLQTFARAEKDQRSPVDVHAVIDSCIRIVNHEIRHRAKLVRDYGEIPHVLANEARLGQVFVNLLMNAAQAIEGARPLQNEIRVSSRLAASGDVIVEVRDTGSGIPLEIQGRIFDPFFTTKDVGVGTGIGLSICHSIVTSLGGELTFDSTPGAGSVFRVRLPSGFPSDPRRAETLAPPASARRARILVVDDEPMIGTALRAMLEPDHEVHVETLARRALDRVLGGESFDLILCDLMMPEVSGVDFYEDVLRLAPSAAGSVVFVTGGAFTDRARTFVEESGVRCLHKPFDLGLVLEEVRKRTG